MSKTSIAWTDMTLNPVIGCTHAAYQGQDGRKVAHPGCDHCYAETMCSRALPGFGAHNRCASGGKWTGKIEVIDERLSWPFTRKEYAQRKDGKPRRCFLTSLADMGHPALPEVDWMAINGMMLLSPWVIWQDLTKRPERQAELLQKYAPVDCARMALRRLVTMGLDSERVCRMSGRPFIDLYDMRWPHFVHIHRYVSVSDQPTADALIPLLLQMPAAVRGVSLEPMIGPVDLAFSAFNGADSFGSMPGINHVIVGGESGRHARPFALEWALDVIEQCKSAKVACFFKQAGSRPTAGGVSLKLRDSKGSDLSELPIELRIQQHI